LVLDLVGGNAAAWSTAFGLIAAIMFGSLLIFLLMRPHVLAGDRSS
jgi:hypothetical protein